MRLDPWPVRFDPSSRGGHVESYFLRINDPDRPRALWIKSTILKKKDETCVAEAWAIAFDRERGHVAEKRAIPFGQARFEDAIEVAGCTMTKERAHGSLGPIAWDVSFVSHGAPFFLYPHERMYTGPLPSQKLLSPMPDIVARGVIDVRGEKWNVEGWRGVFGHNWGKRHTHLYAWGHVSEWSGIGSSPEGASDLVVEVATGRVRVGPVVLPPFGVAVVRHRGVSYPFHALRDIRKNSVRIEKLRELHVRCKSDLGTLEMDFETDDFVGLEYENPSGPSTYCLNSKLARARIVLAVSGRAPLEAISERAAFEIGTHDPHHGVRMFA